jgi:4-diphosphocytidyl-2-C-methyl-D-erythritol kinase
MAAEKLRERASAKVNLTLHIKGRRADGYHELESLVLFAGVHDDLHFTPGTEFSLVVTGPRADATGPVADNLILKAARLFKERLLHVPAGRFDLVKRLPAAAGIGGGSADAAAALRLLCQASGVPLHAPEVMTVARLTGADVPVCVLSRAQMMRGIGDNLEQVQAIAPVFAVLVNAGVLVETKAAFQAIGLAPGEDRGLPPHPPLGAQALATLLACRNDFEGNAILQAPMIGATLAWLRQSADCQLARMSGSGATCFGIFPDCHSAASAARALRAMHPDWWIKPTLLR